MKMKWYTWALGALIIIAIAALLNRARVMKKLKNTKLSENFNLSEFVVTATGIENIPGAIETENLRLLVVNILQPLRSHLGKSIIISSGYRSPLVNKAIGGADSSQHKTGQAADFHIVGMSNDEIIQVIRTLKLPYDQLIDEQLKGKKWVHVSFNKNGGRKQWMTARDGSNGKTVYTTVQTG